MGYREALEAAGAEIYCMESFGDWTGSWWAKVRWNGNVGWVYGDYGSCNCCDAFLAEFDDSYSDEPDLQARLAYFGKSYLMDMVDQEYAEREAYKDAAWDSGAADKIRFITDNRFIEYGRGADIFEVMRRIDEETN